jgi:asparagine synthase (glutamine-hydrolysing)
MWPLATVGLIPQRLGLRLRELAGADDISVIQTLFSWIREDEHRGLWIDEPKLQPVRRWFEPQWEYQGFKNASRLERLSAYATEIQVRLTLPNDFLFKVDTASMKESLEIRVPMLDEELFGFGLSLPHRLKVKGRTCKLVLREIAERRLPLRVAHKPKMGFSIPVDTWVDANFKARLREELLGSTSRLSDVFQPRFYKPLVEAFCNGTQHHTVSRQGLYQRIIMLLSLQLAWD